MTESTESRILDAANELFAERGYAGMTTRLLAARAGVNEVTIFRLFGSKSGVLAALFTRMAAEGIAAEAARGGIPDDAAEAIPVLAMREFEGATRYGGTAARVAFEARSVPEVGELLGEGPIENSHELARRFAAWQEAGQVRDDIDPRVMAEAFASLTSSFVIYRQVMGMQPTGELPAQETMRQLTEVFLGGVLRKREESQ